METRIFVFCHLTLPSLNIQIKYYEVRVSSVVEPKLPFLAGAETVKKGAAPASTLQLQLQLWPYCILKEKKN